MGVIAWCAMNTHATTIPTIFHQDNGRNNLTRRGYRFQKYPWSGDFVSPSLDASGTMWFLTRGMGFGGYAFTMMRGQDGWKNNVVLASIIQGKMPILKINLLV